MKKQTCIGILGGVGPQATEYLYKKIISGAAERYGASENHHFPRVLIISEPVIDFISTEDRLPEARTQVLRAVERLIAGGATHVAIASNTVHLLAEDVATLCTYHSVEFVSMLDAVGVHCKNLGYKQVGLLGSPVLLRSEMYTQVFEKYSISVALPYERSFEQLGCIIKGVIADTVDQEDKELFMAIIAEVAERTDAVVLGCTELPVLASKMQVKLQLVDTSSVLAEALLQIYYTEQVDTKKKEYIS